MVAIIQLKKHVVVTCIFGIIVYKLGYKQNPSLIVLFKVDKSPKIYLYSTIQPFCLAIYYKIKSRREPLFNAKKVAEQ